MNIQDIKTDGKFDPKKVAQHVNNYGAYGLCDLLNSQINPSQETPITQDLLVKAGFKWDGVYEGYTKQSLITKGKKRHNFFVCRKYGERNSLELNVAYEIGEKRLPYNIEMECYPTTMEQIAVVYELHTGKKLSWNGEKVASEEPVSFHVVRGNVVLDKQTGNKILIRKSDFLDGSNFEFVCHSAHDDGDFSYLCTNEYCRCHS